MSSDIRVSEFQEHFCRGPKQPFGIGTWLKKRRKFAKGLVSFSEARHRDSCYRH